MLFGFVDIQSYSYSQQVWYNSAIDTSLRLCLPSQYLSFNTPTGISICLCNTFTPQIKGIFVLQMWCSTVKQTLQYSYELSVHFVQCDIWLSHCKAADNQLLYLSTPLMNLFINWTFLASYIAFNCRINFSYD